MLHKTLLSLQTHTKIHKAIVCTNTGKYNLYPKLSIGLKKEKKMVYNALGGKT